MKERSYLCIDLKSFYASVECVERGLDPMTTNLVVADSERGERTICLAISPAMKQLGIKNRCRVYQIPQNVKYIMASPRMKLYIEYSANIYSIYLKYIAKEDMHVYSIDEVFLDVTDYLSMYQLTAENLAIKIMEDVKNRTGITATVGIGTNLYLSKVALDLMAKRSPINIGYLNEEDYRKYLWHYKPLTDFWRVGSGTANQLSKIGVFTMGDIAQTNEDLLYRMFGVDAELLIDHAWGRESVTIADIKNYRPKSKSISCSQVLARNYNFEECRLVVKEMIHSICLDMADQGIVTSSVSMVIGYSYEFEKNIARGTVSLPVYTNSYQTVISHILVLYENIVEKGKPIRRVNLTCNNLSYEPYEQYDLFTNPTKMEQEKKIQRMSLQIQKKFGRNAILRGMSLQEAGTAIERNKQIGGHKSGE